MKNAPEIQFCKRNRFFCNSVLNGCERHIVILHSYHTYHAWPIEPDVSATLSFTFTILTAINPMAFALCLGLYPLLSTTQQNTHTAPRSNDTKTMSPGELE